MMSFKKMIELYVQYELSDETWFMLRMMTYHGLITNKNWCKFFDFCKDWRINDEGSAIVDGNDKVLYLRDEQGFFKKATK